MKDFADVTDSTSAGELADAQRVVLNRMVSAFSQRDGTAFMELYHEALRMNRIAERNAIRGQTRA